MFEIFGAPCSLPSKTTWIVTTAPVQMELRDTHPRGCPTIHLSKSTVREHLTNTLTTTFVFVFVCFPVRSRIGEANTIVVFALVNGCRQRNLFQPLTASQSTLIEPTTLPGKAFIGQNRQKAFAVTTAVRSQLLHSKSLLPRQQAANRFV